MRRLRRCAPRLSRLNYDLRRAPRIHSHFASNAIRGGLNQRFPNQVAVVGILAFYYFRHNLGNGIDSGANHAGEDDPPVC